MRTIKIDDEIWELLKTKAVPFEDEPNDALRRLLGLSETRPAPPSHATDVNGAADLKHLHRRFDRTQIEEMILKILKEHGGQIRVKDPMSGFNIYQEVGKRLGISRAVQMESTLTGENRWRAEVGFARKNLEQRGIIAPTEVSGRGVWKLK